MNDPNDWIRRYQEMARKYDEMMRSVNFNQINEYLAAIDTSSLSKAMREAELLNSLPSMAADITSITSEAIHTLSTSGAIDEMVRVAAEREKALWKAAENTLLLHAAALSADSVSQIMSTVDLASASLASIKWDELGSAIEASTKWQRDLQFLTNELAFSHSALIERASRQEAGFAAFPEFVTRVPSENLFVHARTMRMLSQHDEYEDDEDAQSVVSEHAIDDEVDAIFETLLPKLNPEFPKMLRGAEEVWRQKNADWPRHMASSFRELFLGVFHNVAPDAEVEKIITDPATEHDPEGHPTRSVKIRYLCRNIRIEEYRRVVEVDLTAAVECLKIINEGVHSASGEKFERQVEKIRRRVRVGIRHMLNIWGYSNN